jgi:hypothetical protein
MNEFYSPTPEDSVELSLSDQLQSLIDAYGLQEVERQLYAIREKKSTEFSQTSIYKAMSAQFPDASLYQDGSTLVVAEDRAFLRTVNNDFVEAADMFRNNPIFDDIRVDGFNIYARLTNPDGELKQ